jgi:hypothetical protein
MAIQFESSIDVDGRGIIGSGNTIGTINASIIGANNNATTLSTVDSNTNTIIGDSNSGRYGNTVITDRTLRIGRADNIGATSSNTTGILNFNDFVLGNTAYSNVGGFCGYFPPPTTSNPYLFFNAHDADVLDSVFSTGSSPEAARINMSFDPQFGTNSGGNAGNSATFKADSNNSSGAGLYFNVSQNNTSASSRGIVTFDIRHQNQNANVPDGHSLFEVTAGYGNSKFLIKQVSGSTNVGIGTTSPASRLQVNTGSDINAQIGLDSFGSFKLGDVSNNYAGRGIYYDGTAGSEDLDVLTNTFNIAGNFGEGIKVVSGGDVQLSSPIGVALTIDGTNSNVGIGETNPDTLLHITGNEPTIKLEDNVAVDYYNPKIEFFGSLEGGTLEYLSNPGFSGMRLHYRSAGTNQDTYLELKNGQAAFTSANITGGVNVSMTGELQVFGGDTSYFSGGNVAIGATTATERLVVSGNAWITNNVYIGSGNTLKTCTYSAQYSLAVGQNNILGGVSNGIIGVSNTIDCTAEPWLGFGGNFIAGKNNEILGSYSHANAVFGQNNSVAQASVSEANNLVGGQQNTLHANSSFMYGTSGFATGDNSLTGGFDSNNFSDFGGVAIGAGATASLGYNQYAFGTGVTTPTTLSNAYQADQFVVGKYNEYTNASLVPHRFAVGNGASDASRDTPFCIIGAGTYTNGQVSINDADGFAYTGIPYSIFHVNGRATSTYSSVFTVTSDERLKKDILDYNKGLAEILQVQPKSYSFNGKANTIENVESIGVLAQEIKEVFPETIGTVNKRLNPEDEQETELYTVDISPVTYALINAVKELNAKVEALEARIQTLEGN